jgi:rRNA maturation endonuclease Nob1
MTAVSAESLGSSVRIPTRRETVEVQPMQSIPAHGLDMSDTLRVVGCQIHSLTKKLEAVQSPNEIIELTEALRKLIALAREAREIHSYPAAS